MKQTVIDKRRNNTQNNTKTRITQHRVPTYTHKKNNKKIKRKLKKNVSRLIRK